MGNVIISSSIMQNLLKIGIETTDNDAIGKKIFFQVRTFLAYVIERFKTKGYSPDVTVGFARVHRLFSPAEMVCTTTLYKYIDKQRLEIKNIDLLRKAITSSSTAKQGKNRKVRRLCCSD